MSKMAETGRKYRPLEKKRRDFSRRYTPSRRMPTSCILSLSKDVAAISIAGHYYTIASLIRASSSKRRSAPMTPIGLPSSSSSGADTVMHRAPVIRDL